MDKDLMLQTLQEYENELLSIETKTEALGLQIKELLDSGLDTADKEAKFLTLLRQNQLLSYQLKDLNAKILDIQQLTVLYKNITGEAKIESIS